MGVKSSPVKSSTRIPGSPAAPTEVHAIPGERDITVFWVQPQQVTEQFLYVQRFINQYETESLPGFPKKLGIDFVGHTIKDLQPSTTYTIQIQEGNSVGRGPKSQTLLVHTKAVDPNAPIELSQDDSVIEIASSSGSTETIIITIVCVIAGLLICKLSVFSIIQFTQKKKATSENAEIDDDEKKNEVRQIAGEREFQGVDQIGDSVQ